MEENWKYLEEAAPRMTTMDEVMPYVEALEQMKADMLTQELELDRMKKDYKELSESILPSLLEQHGLEELKLSNGKRLAVKESIFARLPEDPLKREELLAWLTEHGGGEKIKDEATLEEIDEAVISVLEKANIAFSRRRTVNTNSLQAWFNEALGLKKGSIATVSLEDIPSSFGVYIKREAVIR